MLPIFPYSPMPGGITRSAFWNENVQTYDSGADQGFSNYVKPLYRYTIPLSIYNEIKQANVWPFFRDQTRGMLRPFYIKDPYDQYSAPATAVRSGLTNGASLHLYDTNSYSIRVDTTSIGSLASVLSGYVRLGVEFTYNIDSGMLVVNTKATGDVWTYPSTVSYYRKVRLAQGFTESAMIWNVFGGAVTLNEVI